MKNDFLEKGFTKIFYVDLGIDLKRLQEKIYSLTSKLLIDHDPSIGVSKRIQLPFKQLPTNNDWSAIMNKINDSIMHDIWGTCTTFDSIRNIYYN